MLFFLTFSLSYLLTNYNEERGNKNKNKMTPKTYQSFDENTTGTIEKILTRWIQWHQKRSQKINEVGNTSHPKVSELTCLWATRVTHFDHR